MEFIGRPIVISQWCSLFQVDIKAVADRGFIGAAGGLPALQNAFYDLLFADFQGDQLLDRSSLAVQQVVERFSLRPRPRISVKYESLHPTARFVELNTGHVYEHILRYQLALVHTFLRFKQSGVYDFFSLRRISPESFSQAPSLQLT